LIRVLIADDHPIVRRGLRNILAAETDMTVQEATDGAAALKAIEAGPFDVLVLDLNMPQVSGLDVLRALKGRRPGLRVLLLSALPEYEAAVRVIRSSAGGYLSKEMAPEELVAAIRRVAAGSRHIGTDLGELLADSLTASKKRVRSCAKCVDREAPRRIDSIRPPDRDRIAASHSGRHGSCGCHRMGSGGIWSVQRAEVPIGLTRGIDWERATAMFHIFQETLTNVARHSMATELTERLARENGDLSLEVHDNGKGISEEKLSEGQSLGILGMRERALLLGGELIIRGNPGQGTTVKVRIPAARHN
jgi:DNA-binding NarL/FixJ family response regulator